MRRRLFFRGVRLLLECGHEAEEGTSFFRLSEGRAACIVGSFIRRGVFCDECRTYCQPEKYLGTCRMSEAKEIRMTEAEAKTKSD